MFQLALIKLSIHKKTQNSVKETVIPDSSGVGSVSINSEYNLFTAWLGLKSHMTKKNMSRKINMAFHYPGRFDSKLSLTVLNLLKNN